MSQSPAFKHLLFLCIIAFGTASASTAEARPVKAKQGNFPYKITVKGEAIRVEIGRRKSVNEGNIASLNALAHIVRKYPKATLYSVDWMIKGKKGETHDVTTFFARCEGMLLRESWIISGKGVPMTQLRYDSIAPDRVIEVGAYKRNFDAFEELTMNDAQQYWH